MTGAAPPPETGAAVRFSLSGKLLMLFVLIMGIAMLIFGWDDAITVVTQLSLAKIALLCVLSLLHYGIRALRWHMLVYANGIALSFRRNALHLFGGFAMTATPGRLGELFRLRWMQRETGYGFTRLLPVAFADRAIELASMLLLIIGMLALSNLQTNAIWGLLTVTTALVLISCRPRILEAFILGIWHVLGQRKPRLFAKLRRMSRHLEPIMHLSVLLPVLLVGVVGWACEGIAFWLLLGWLDVPLSLPIAVNIFLIAILAGALSGLPGGFGSAEVTGIALLALQAVPLESAVMALLIIRLTTLWFAVLIGLIIFPMAEAQSKLPRNRISNAD